MGFSLFHAVAGAADRATELRDEERQNARDIAKQTLDYQLRNADSLREERANKLAEKSATAKKLYSFGYDKEQILTLARNGDMDKALSYHEYIREKRLDPVDADTVVKKSGSIPKNSSFDEEFKKAVIGVPSQIEQAKLDTEEAKKERGFWSRVFNPDTSKETSSMRTTAAKGAGYASADELAIESRRYTTDPNADMGEVNMDAFAGIKAADTDYWTKAKSAAGIFSSGLLSDTLDIDATYDGFSGTFTGFDERTAATRAFTRAHETAQFAISSMLKADRSVDTADASKILSDDYRKTVSRSPELDGLTGDARKTKLAELTEAWSDKWSRKFVAKDERPDILQPATDGIPAPDALPTTPAVTSPPVVEVPTVVVNDVNSLTKALRSIEDEDVKSQVRTAFQNKDMEEVNRLIKEHSTAKTTNNSVVEEPDTMPVEEPESVSSYLATMGIDPNVAINSNDPEVQQKLRNGIAEYALKTTLTEEEKMQFDLLSVEEKQNAIQAFVNTVDGEVALDKAINAARRGTLGDEKTPEVSTTKSSITKRAKDGRTVVITGSFDARDRRVLNRLQINSAEELVKAVQDAGFDAEIME